ncbi:hypothetical protein ACE1TF_05790 [Geomicrobium sp. JSM 1781026]|uniref:hypothetical protein n=1 Tax=Geomicrobium sp. JSM 1781026 TaxID=3344580 RepID=UPI0035BF9733
MIIVFAVLFLGLVMIWPEVFDILRKNAFLGYLSMIIVCAVAFLAILDVYKSHFEIEKFTGKMIFQATLYIVALLIIILMIRNM